MSTFLSKIFPGSSSSSSNTDLGSMESLCSAINDLLRKEEKEFVGELAADLVRKNKDLFEKKPNDVEAFLLHCSPNVGSAAMVAAIKGMFDVSAAKSNETGTDRAVELLNHYVDENNFVGEHLKLVPEIIFPLLHNVGMYCLEKKGKPEIGQKIILKALSSMYPRNGESPKVLTSAHSVLFACALKTKDYAVVAPFIDVYIDEIANEKCVSDHEDNVFSIMNKYPKKVMSHHASMNTTSSVAAPPPFLNPKFVLEYLYYGACILIELKRYEDALLLLEVLISIPAFSLLEIQVDGYKKFVLLSLLLNGKVVNDSSEKLSGVRNVKTKSQEYKVLSEIRFSRSDNTHSKLDELFAVMKEKLKRDGNSDLAKLVSVEMKKKAILSLTKMFSSIKISEIQTLSFLKSREQTEEIIGKLVEDNRITVRVEEEMVFWEEVTPLPSKTDIDNKIRLVDSLNALLNDKNENLRITPGRLRPHMMYNEDEGLSMPPIDH